MSCLRGGITRFDGSIQPKFRNRHPDTRIDPELIGGPDCGTDSGELTAGGLPTWLAVLPGPDERL